MHDFIQRGQMGRDESDKSVSLTVRLTSLHCIGACSHTQQNIKKKSPGANMVHALKEMCCMHEGRAKHYMYHVLMKEESK